jgi:hypothetical protein
LSRKISAVDLPQGGLAQTGYPVAIWGEPFDGYYEILIFQVKGHPGIYTHPVLSNQALDSNPPASSEMPTMREHTDCHVPVGTAFRQ